MRNTLNAAIVNSVKFEAAAEILATHLRHVLRLSKLVDPQVVPTRVSSRAKSAKSALVKIARKRKEGLKLNTPRSVETHITDLAAARVVCDYLTDIVLIHGYLERHPAIRILRHATEDYVAKPKNGYRGVHLLVEVQTAFGKAVCEVQIRTMLQHAWAEKSHDMLYKLKKRELDHIPKHIRNLMENQSNMLYELDRIGVEIAAAVREHIGE